MIDPLSDILLLLRPNRQGSGAINFGGDWAAHFPAYGGLRCYAVSRGECWIEVEGAGGPVHLVRDDCMLLASGAPFWIGSASDAEPISVADMALFSQDKISTAGPVFSSAVTSFSTKRTSGSYRARFRSLSWCGTRDSAKPWDQHSRRYGSSWRNLSPAAGWLSTI